MGLNFSRAPPCVSFHYVSSSPPHAFYYRFCFLFLPITYHHVFLSSCMQPAGSYAKVTNMISKIIAGILGDGQQEVTLLQWWKIVF